MEASRSSKRRVGVKSRSNRRSGYSSNKSSPDRILLIVSSLLLIFGLVMIFDASIYQADNFFDNRFHFVVQQVVWIALGLVAGAIFYFWDYHKFSKLAVPWLIVSFILLVTVLLLGNEINGSRRWFEIGPIPIQPAELAKPAIILYLCTWLSKERNTSSKAIRLKEHLVNHLLPFALVLGLFGVLIILEPDLGTTIIICAVSFSIYFFSGNDKVHLIGSGIFVLVGGLLGAIAATLESYRLERLKTFFDLWISGKVSDPRGAGYQMQQILIGIGSGGFFGKGFGESRQRFGYLVENTAFTDSIFAIILEELGMVGGLFLIAMFLVVLYRAYIIAIQAPDKLGRLLAGGLGFWIIFQAFMHMGANVGIVPLTGVPLPFLTYGGSSTVVALMGMGMLLNVSKYRSE